jgi:hypothetical protein
MLRLRASRVCRREFSASTGASIEWEELLPFNDPPKISIDDMDEPIEAKQRFYVPPPFTDEQLLRMAPAKIMEWPKSRIVWALGRFGFSDKLKNSDNKFVHDQLLARSIDLLDTLNTRDIVRILQAVAYGPKTDQLDNIFLLRRNACTRIESISDLFLVSLLFGHLKLVGRLDWSVSSNCNQTTQFLLSELIHRKSRIDASRFVELTSALLCNAKIIKSHNDSVQMVLRHAVEGSLKHVKDAVVLEKFAKALCNIPSTAFLVSVNSVLEKKFEKTRIWKHANDALRIGFFFFLNDLMSAETVLGWLKCIKAAENPLSLSKEDKPRTVLENKQLMHLVRIVLKHKKPDCVLDNSMIEWIESVPSIESVDTETLYSNQCSEPLIGAESLHVGSVLRRMVQQTTENGICPTFVAPFHLSAAIVRDRVWIEWSDQYEIEQPYRRGVAKLLSTLRRAHLESIGWKCILLKKTDFKPTGSSESYLNAVNMKFKETLSRIAEIKSVDWKPICSQPNISPKREKTLPVSFTCAVDADQIDPIKRERRESNTKAWRVKSKLKMISKEFRKKQNRRLKVKRR